MVQATTSYAGAFTDPADQDTYIQLGFGEVPKNKLVTKAQFTPSKIGGEPAWIAPAIPEEKLICEKCSTPFCFITQVYSNLEHMDEYHRMLYLFACVSPDCIKRSDSVKAFRAVIHDRNQFITFASDSDYKFVVEKSDKALSTSKYADLFDNAKSDDEEDGADDDADGEDEKKEETITTTPATSKSAATKMFGALPFKPKLKEYMIDTAEEDLDSTLLYVKHARRLAADAGSSTASRAAQEMNEQLELAFVAQNFKGNS